VAILNNIQSGNFTAASTWGVIDPISFQNSVANTSTTTTAYVESQSFIPGAITIDAIGIRVAGSSVVSGTFSVRLALAGVTVPGTEVTINVADIFTNGGIGFVLMKFAAPVLLVAATSYTVSVKSSVNATVTVIRNATAGNWSRFLRTTTTAAPAAADTLFVTGEFLSAGVNTVFTVTFDNTAATVFGELDISQNGILNSATAASTAYQFITNNKLSVRGGATLQIGTLANPIPASSSFLLQINQAGVNVNFGLLITSGATFRTYGASKVNRAFLAADAAVAATSLTTNISTSWLSGEEVVIAPTTATSSQLEVRALSANAVGTTLTVPALTFAHQGTGDFVGEIANISRNIRIKSDSASFGTYVSFSSQSTVDLNYAEFMHMGSATTNKRGFDVATTIGSFNMLGCSLHRWQANSQFLFAGLANNITIQDSIFYNVGNGLANVTSVGNNWLVNGCWGFNTQFSFANTGGTLTNILATGGFNGIFFNATSNTNLTVSGITAHSNISSGINISSSTLQGQTFSNLITWRNLRGINTNASSNVTLNNHISYGNTFSGLAVTACFNLTVENSTYYASTTILQPAGVALESSAFNTVFNSCSFGLPTAHATGDINVSTARVWHELKLNNCLFGSTNEVAGLANLSQNAFIGSSKHDQTNGVHRGWKRTAILSSDSVIQATAPLSVRITPSVLSTKTNSSAKGFAIPSGLTATVSALVRRSVVGDGTAYNGALPRLWLRQNNSAGITTDTLLATATAASLGAFEALIGSIPAGTDNTVNYIYVDCDGTTGWVNVDKWSLVIVGGSANGTNINYEDYWQDGVSYPGINTNLTNNTNNETYWIDGIPVPQLYPVSVIQTGKFFLLFE
jgi:hypothetical protein